jgi:O-antigen/teichoic acid export membrane protein
LVNRRSRGYKRKVTASAAQRLILKGGGSAALGFVIRFGARLLFVLVAGRLYGAALFGAFAIAVAVIELAVTIGGAGMKRLLFKLLDEKKDGRTPPHLLIDGVLLVTLASLACAAPIMLAMAFIPGSAVADNTEAALLLLAPMILGQALLDLLLAATRWTHKMRHQVWARSIVEPYAGVAASALAWWAGYQATGLVIGYWVGTLAALLYSFAAARACLGPFRLRAWRFSPARLRDMFGQTWPATMSDFANALAGRVDLYLVGLFLGEAPAGIYGMARQVRTPIRQVRQSFDGLLTPIVSRTLTLTDPARTARATASAARLILAIQAPILIALFVLGAPLLHWIGPEFAAGYWAMLMLAATESIQGAFGVSDLIFLYRRPAALLWVTATWIAVNFAAGWLLIPTWGVDGAALAALVAIVAASMVRRLLLHTGFEAAIPLRTAAPPLIGLAAGIGAAALLMTLPASDGLRYGLALIAGLAACYAALRSTLKLTGESLALTGFVTDMAEGAAENSVRPPGTESRESSF